MKTVVAFKGKRATGHGADLSPLPSGVKNEGSHSQLPHTPLPLFLPKSENDVSESLMF